MSKPSRRPGREAIKEQRMLFIHEQLKHGRYPNCVQLGVEFELKGVRTILRDRRWHASQQVTELPGGEIRMSFRLDSLEEIEPWVLSWGAHATVIRPKAQADRVSAAADAVRKKYAKPAKPRDGQMTLLEMVRKGLPTAA